MPVTLLGFTLQGFSLSKSRIPFGTFTSLAVKCPLGDLGQPQLFLGSAFRGLSFRVFSAPPDRAGSNASALPPKLVPEVAQRFPQPAFRRSRTASRRKLNLFDGALLSSSLTCRSWPWRNLRLITPTSESCSLRESVPPDASASRSRRPMPSWVFPPL